MPRILLIEDDLLTRKIVQKVLSRENYEVDSASNGIEAFEFLEKNIQQYDLIITDLMMPNSNGFEIVKKALSLKSGPPIPVFIISNAGNEDTVMESFRSGATDFIRKPIIPAELLERVRAILKK